MGRKKLGRILKALIAIAMVQAPIVSEAKSGGGGGVCESRDTCKKAYNDAKLKAGKASATAGLGQSETMHGGAGALQSASTATAGLACDVVTTCQKKKESCKPDANGCKEQDCKEIDSIIGQAQAECSQAGAVAAGAGQTQSSTGAGGGGGDMSAMMGPLMMAGMMAAMMMKKKDDEKPQQDPNAALQLNGQLDCSKMDAYNYQGCNSYMEKKCAAQLDEATCSAFSARYCSGSASAASSMAVAPPTIDPVTGAVIGGGAPVMGQAGEGVGSPFCQNVMAYNFCKTSGRESCPSCLQLQKNSSPACIQNPSLCMAQNSSTEIEKAKLSCPTDPAFSNPNFSGVSTPYASSTPGAPAVVLPNSVGSSGQGSSASSSYSGGPSTGSNYMGVASVGGNNSATREGQPLAGANANSGVGAGGSSSGVAGAGFVPSSVGGRRELAGANGAYREASLASDIQPKYSPSLFTTASAVYRDRCASGRTNCP